MDDRIRMAACERIFYQLRLAEQETRKAIEAVNTDHADDIMIGLDAIHEAINDMARTKAGKAPHHQHPGQSLIDAAYTLTRVGEAMLAEALEESKWRRKCATELLDAKREGS